MKTTMMVFLTIAAFSLASTSCGNSTSQSRASARSSAATVAESVGPVVQYPLVLSGDAVPKDVRDAANAAKALSQQLDQKCALLAMNAELTAKRPGGTGCPRPPSNHKGAN